MFVSILSLLIPLADNLFQAVRSGGFYVVTISGLRQGLLVLYGKFLCSIYLIFLSKS